MQILKFSEVQLWISSRSLEGKRINNHFMWVDRLSNSSSKEPPQPVAEQAHPEWPHLLWSFCWHHPLAELKTVHSCRITTVVSAQLERESFCQWCCFLGRDQFIHAEGFSNPFSNVCCISKRTYGGIYNQKAAELGSSVCLFQKIQIHLEHW